MSKHCNTCKKRLDIMKRCTRCLKIYYCSRQCQIDDWAIHKGQCSIQTDTAHQEPSGTAEVLTHPQKHGSGFSYLHHDEFMNDVPRIDHSLELCEIVVRHNKQKDKIELHPFWTGSDIFKYLSSVLSIPLDNLQLIHKGKKLTEESVNECIIPKAVILALGDQALPEEGVNSKDVEVLMKQLQIDRNSSIKALQKHGGNLVDAILDLGGK